MDFDGLEIIIWKQTFSTLLHVAKSKQKHTTLSLIYANFNAQICLGINYNSIYTVARNLECYRTQWAMLHERSLS